jgi:hypothetical protein
MQYEKYPKQESQQYSLHKITGAIDLPEYSPQLTWLYRQPAWLWFRVFLRWRSTPGYFV